MATQYEDINAYSNDRTMAQVRVATMVAAQAIIERVGGESPPGAGEIAWAKSVLSNLDYEAARMFRAVLAANVAIPVATIATVDDATVQAAVDAAVALFTAA
jgi:hypothetical protein